MENKIPRLIADKICEMPEVSYGSNRVRVTLRDGSRFGSVVVAWGDEIIAVGTATDIPFDPADIVAVENDA